MEQKDINKHKRQARSKWCKIENDIGKVRSEASTICGYCHIHKKENGDLDCRNCEMNWRGVCYKGGEKPNLFRRWEKAVAELQSVSVLIFEGINLDMSLGTDKPKPKKRKIK